MNIEHWLPANIISQYYLALGVHFEYANLKGKAIAICSLFTIRSLVSPICCLEEAQPRHLFLTEEEQSVIF